MMMANPTRLFAPILSALLLSACAGSAPVSMKDTPEPTPSAEAALRGAFAEQAALVLGQGEGFAPGPRGFASSVAELPGDGSGALVLHAEGGLEVRVHEVGSAGTGEPAGRAVAYPRARGASFWTADGAGVEEWLYAEPGEAEGGAPLAAWEVEGATLRQRGSAVEIVDASGEARIEVTAPLAFAAGGRPIAAWLEAEGARLALHVEPTADAVLVDPAWSPITPLPVPRYAPTFALLPNGKAFVVGGMGPFLGPPEQQTDVTYDPVSGAWTTGSTSMAEPQYFGFMTLLQNGKVFIAGGLNQSPESATCELYDPTTDAWSPAASMPTILNSATAVRLKDGRAMLIGGPDAADNPSAVTEIYDPSSNSWTVSASMATPRYAHTATVLVDGRVLVVGGSSDTLALADCELYDPVADKWSTATPMSQGRLFHAAVRLQSGKVLVVGGGNGFNNTVMLGSTEIYDPTMDRWTPGPSLAIPREPDIAVLLQDGTVLVASGVAPTVSEPLAAAERFDPVSFQWLGAGAMLAKRYLPATVLLPDGSVLVAGGYDGTQVLAEAELFTLVPKGGACTASGECASLSCVQGVCCDSACGPDPCHACAKAQGATADGTCTPLTGPTCDDGDLCTTTAACVAGACTRQTAVSCASLDTCHPGACDPASGLCQFPAAPDGTPCDDHDTCTHGDACTGGVCLGASPTACQAQDDCHDAACDPQTGACVQSSKHDGAPCDDHDACTHGDACTGGLCAGGTAVVCVAQDACHAAGVCDPQTGCTNPVLPSCGSSTTAAAALTNGDPCVGDASCASGHCAHGVCCDSACTGTCFSCALPGTRGTCTAEPEGIDLNGDCGVGPNCVSTCAPGGGACTGAMAGTQCLPARCADAHTLLEPAICPAEGAPCPEGQSAPHDCAPYACQAAFGACAKGCRSVADCAPGYVCDPDFQCARPPDVAGGSDGGCAVGPGAPAPEGVPVLWTLGACAALALRRRRASTRCL